MTRRDDLESQVRELQDELIAKTLALTDANDFLADLAVIYPHILSDVGNGESGSLNVSRGGTRRFATEWSDGISVRSHWERSGPAYAIEAVHEAASILRARAEFEAKTKTDRAAAERREKLVEPFIGKQTLTATWKPLQGWRRESVDMTDGSFGHEREVPVVEFVDPGASEADVADRFELAVRRVKNSGDAGRRTDHERDSGVAAVVGNGEQPGVPRADDRVDDLQELVGPNDIGVDGRSVDGDGHLTGHDSPSVGSRELESRDASSTTVGDPAPAGSPSDSEADPAGVPVSPAPGTSAVTLADLDADIAYFEGLLRAAKDARAARLYRGGSR